MPSALPKLTVLDSCHEHGRMRDGTCAEGALLLEIGRVGIADKMIFKSRLLWGKNVSWIRKLPPQGPEIPLSAANLYPVR